VSATLYHSEPGIEIHCGRVEDVLATIDPKTVALLSADPPYGTRIDNNRTSKRQRYEHGREGAKIGGGKVRIFADVEGDDRPFDPAQLLAFGRPSVLWGANHYGSRVPDSPSWIFWDKREGQTSDDNADGELAWSNLGGPLRVFRHFWRGAMRKTEKEAKHTHPTQKPVALYSWLFSWRTKPGDLIVAPYAGSGPDVAAARMLGRRIIAIECDESYCAEIVKRLRQPLLPMTTPVAAEPVATADLFSRIGGK
jgi:site-specific DNA-methyltransferase (adenine-specific)